MSVIKSFLICQRLGKAGAATPFVWSHPSTMQVRHRKPKWLVPKRAPSKEGIYFHHPRPSKYDSERGELMYKSYNSLLRSIVAAFQEEILLAAEKGKDSSSSKDQWDEDEHHANCMAYNERANEEMRKIRSERLKKILEEQQSTQMEGAAELNRDLKKRMQKFESEVEDCLKDCENWLNMDNLEEKINEALDNAVNFNFAVRKNGLISSRTLQP